MNLIDLNNDVRKIMYNIIDTDKILYISNRLTDAGKNKYKAIFLENVINGDIRQFASDIKKYMLEDEITKNGFKKIPLDANITLCYGQFNKYYILGLCEYAIKNNIDTLKVYRSKKVDNPRLDSEELIGQKLNPRDEIFIELKDSSFKSKFCQPNSGISVMIDR